METKSLVQALLMALVYAGAGSLFFIYIFNRRMHRMRSGMDKIAVLLGLCVLTLALPAALGWILAWNEGLSLLARWIFPILVGLTWLWGDTRLAWQKYVLRGAEPVEVKPTPRQGVDFLCHPITTLDLTQVTYQVIWDGPALTVAQITDLHLNSQIPLRFYQQAVEWANQTNPDLIFLSGDFVTHRHNIPSLADLLLPLHTTEKVVCAGIPPGKAVFASLGNHDYWADAPWITDTVQTAGATFLSGKWVDILVDDKTIRLGGDDSPWGPGINTLTPTSLPKGEGEINLIPIPVSVGDKETNLTPIPLSVGDKGKGEMENIIPSLILSHAPDNIYRLVKLPGCAAVFSGHVHAGQMRLPLPGSFSGSTALIVPSVYGRRFDHGHFMFRSPDGQPVHLFVCAGVGAAEPPLRLYCPPEVLVVKFIPN